MNVRRKRYITRPRLPSTAYGDSHVFHVTIVTRGREPLLIDSGAKSIVEAMRDSASRTGVWLLAYCVMPDHVHILAQTDAESSSVLRFVQRFKQRTSYDEIRRTGSRLWQPSFHDHALRSLEDVNEVAAYIFGNPVEAGMTTDASRWTYSGGTLFEAFCES